MTGSDNLAAHREKQRANRFWTPDRVLASFQQFSQKMGRWPTAGDTNFAAPSTRRWMSEKRWEESKRAHDLGLRLPGVDIAKREFGSWGAARTAAAESAPVDLHIPVADEVCPRCGEFVLALNERTGWCAPCVFDVEKVGVDGYSTCPGCGGERDRETVGCRACLDRRRKKRRSLAKSASGLLAGSSPAEDSLSGPDAQPFIEREAA